jgi:electron transport complex protein RnfG
LPDLRKYLRKYYPVVFLLIIFAVCVDMLAMVYQVAEPIIAGSEEEKIVEQLETAFPDAEWVKVAVEPDDGDEYSIYVVVEDDTIKNFSFVGARIGAQAEIRVMASFNYEVALGVDFDPNDVVNEATVELVYVVKQTETPGLGALIIEPEFTDPFIGLLVDQIGIKPNGELDTITGATISSTAMIELVRATADDKLAALPSAQDIQAALEAKRAEEAAAAE